jgi:predicted DsbA family dithiol-disulfide isomerase
MAGVVARLDIISDAICPWCYIGKRQFERAVSLIDSAQLQFDVSWRAYQLNPDMPQDGLRRADYRAFKFGAGKAVELDRRITEAAAGVGLGFRTDLMTRTPNTVDAHRIIWLSAKAGPAMQDEMVEILFHAYFVEGRDIGDRAVLTELAADAGLEHEAVAMFLAGSEGRAEILAEDRDARAAGLSGVPTFVMEGQVLFSGALPADAMAEAFVSAWAVLRKQAA